VRFLLGSLQRLTGVLNRNRLANTPIGISSGFIVSALKYLLPVLGCQCELVKRAPSLTVQNVQKSGFKYFNIAHHIMNIGLLLQLQEPFTSFQSFKSSTSIINLSAKFFYIQND